MSIRILDSYIAKTVLAAVGLVTLMLAGLQIFILFISQMDDLGKGDYGIVQAAWFVLFQLPYQIYLFFPMASLLGCLVGLGVMANHSELIVMRSAGMSIGQITWAVLKASIIIIIILTAAGETIVPFLSHLANDYKTTALTGGQALRTSQGVWLRNGNNFIFVGAVLPGNLLRDVFQFQFDTTHQLKIARDIGEAQFIDNAWVIYKVKQTEFDLNKTKSTQIASMPWDVLIKPHILKISGINPEEMTLHELNRYIREQKRNHQSAHNYKFAFLQRIMQPVTTIVMMILAIPFVFGPLRSSSMGSKLLVGATVGFGFHIINRFFGPVSAVFQWPAELAALGPTIIFALLGIYFMKRVR